MQALLMASGDGGQHHLINERCCPAAALCLSPLTGLPLGRGSWRAELLIKAAIVLSGVCVRVWLRCRLLTSFSLWALALQAELGCNGSLWDELHPGCRVGKAEALCSCRPLGLSNVLWGEAGTAAAPGGRAAGVATEETPLAPAALPLLQVLLPIPGVCEYSFLSGELNILNKHCLKSIIYGRSFRRGDQSLPGAQGGSPSAQPPLLCSQSTSEAEGISLGLEQRPDNPHLRREKATLPSLAGRSIAEPSAKHILWGTGPGWELKGAGGQWEDAGAGRSPCWCFPLCPSFFPRLREGGLQFVL